MWNCSGESTRDERLAAAESNWIDAYLARARATASAEERRSEGRRVEGKGRAWSMAVGRARHAPLSVRDGLGLGLGLGPR